MLPVSEMRGKNAARAAPMLALLAISNCSAWRTSGRRVRTSEGTPAGSSGNVADAVIGSPGGRSAGNGCPISKVSAFSSSARSRRACASATCAAASSDSDWRRSICELAPLSKRSLVRRYESSRVCRVCSVTRSSSSSACSAKCALATLATSEICTALRASSVARYWASAASLRLRTRPYRSSSYDVTSRPAEYSVLTLPLPLGWRDPPTPAFTVGSRSARRMSNCARACSMLSTATRRSRL